MSQQDSQTSQAPSPRTSALVPPLLLALLAAFLMLGELGGRSLEDWDEGIYAEVAREMAVSGDWLTPHWNFQVWFEKPPLLMWATAASFRLFGVNEFWARFPAALCGIGLVILVHIIARRIAGAQAGVLGALILVSSYLFLFLARHAMTDVPLCFFLWLAVYGFLRVREGRSVSWYLVWCSLALAFMVKGPAAVVAPAAIAITLVLDRQLKATVKTRPFWWGLTLAVCIAAPWPLLMWIRHGVAFLNEFAGYHVVARAATLFEETRTEDLYYLKSVLRGSFPWVLLFPFAVWFGIRESRRDSGYKIVLLMVAVTVLLYSLVRTKAYWYLLPMYPGLAILTGALMDRACKLRARFRRAIFLAVGFGVWLVLYANLQYANVLPAEVHLRWAPLYEGGESVMANLGRLASAGIPEREPLILCSDSAVISMISALFYSGRQVQQAFVTKRPYVSAVRRYYNPQRLSDLLDSETRWLILPRNELSSVADSGYDVEPVSESHSFVLTRIRRRPGPR